MYGDTAVMRRRVDQLREQGADLRGLADQLVGRSEQVDWSGRAADAMRERIRHRAARLRACAARHDSAADALEDHLRDVDDLKDSIARVERRASALAADRDQQPAAFTPPPPGHRDWLTVELPGR